LLWAGLSQGQSVPLAELETCAGLATAELKLACFEGLVSGEQEKPATKAPVKPGSALEETPAAAPAESPPAAPVAASTARQASDPADAFGREHLQDDEPGSLQARVTEVEKNRYGALIFHLDNGQVWRQMEPRYFPYPRSAEFDVLITTGMMGEYRLQVDGGGRKVKIKRVK